VFVLPVFIWHYCFVWVVIFITVLWNSFGIFRVALLFICQGTKQHFVLLQMCFKHLFLLLLLFNSNFDIISCLFYFVNNFFRLFSISFEVIFSYPSKSILICRRLLKCSSATKFRITSFSVLVNNNF